MFRILQKYTHSKLFKKTLSFERIVFVVNTDLTIKFLERLRPHTQIYNKTIKLLTPYQKEEYKYYSDTFLLSSLKKQQKDFLQNIQKNIPISQTGEYTPDTIIIVIRKILNTLFSFKQQWSVHISNKYRIVHKNFKIYISGKTLKYNKLISILYHELAVHLYRSQKSHNLAVSIKFNDYFTFEEGLAKIFETIGTEHENQPKFSFLPILMILSDLGMNDDELSNILSVICVSEESRIKFFKTQTKSFKLKFKSLSYIIGYQQVQYFSSSFKQSNIVNPHLFQAFTKITNILMDYKLNPLNFRHVQILSKKNILSLTKEETREYKIFTKKRETIEINRLSAGINEQIFQPNYE